MIDAYRTSRRNLIIASALLIAWDLFGLRWGPYIKNYIEIGADNERIAPLLTIILIFFFAFRTSIDWINTSSDFRSRRINMFDFFIAHIIGIVALLSWRQNYSWSIIFSEKSAILQIIEDDLGRMIGVSIFLLLTLTGILYTVYRGGFYRQPELLRDALVIGPILVVFSFTIYFWGLFFYEIFSDQNYRMQVIQFLDDRVAISYLIILSLIDVILIGFYIGHSILFYRQDLYLLFFIGNREIRDKHFMYVERYLEVAEFEALVNAGVKSSRDLRSLARLPDGALREWCVHHSLKKETIDLAIEGLEVMKGDE